MEEQIEQGTMVPREEPELAEARKALVTKLASNVRKDKKHWEKAFNRIKEDRKFAFGCQWSEDPTDDRYVANITLRHIQQRVAALYAKNPKVVARPKERLMSTVWDGSMTAVMGAMEQLAVLGQTPMGAMSPEAAKAQTILQEAQQVTEYQNMVRNFARTLELFYEYNVQEQAHPFKAMMKLVVRRAVTTAVGYTKLGFQRVMEPDPDVEARLADATQKLATLERISSDIADDEIPDETSAELERLRLLTQDLQNAPELVVREGLTFDYPDSLAIIPDRNCRQLREFLGCEYVTQEYVLSPERVQEIYGVDVKKSYTKYKADSDGNLVASGSTDPGDGEEENAVESCVVWEIWHRADGMVYTVCDGYPDFLREPASPEIWTERFWPWFPLVLNESDNPDEVYPPSDVRLVMHQQKEYNRLREGLREHRSQNRPLTASSAGVLSDEDKEVLGNRPANAHIELDGLQPGQKVSDLLQAVQFPGVDPNLYEANGVFEDVLRTVGVQEANLGGASGNTATETSIAESSRMSSLQSSIDELDDMLSDMARTAGQILMDNVEEATVKEAIGDGAIWPQMSRDQLAKEVLLEVEAGSTGRPNQAQEIQNFERMAPLIMQIPGIKIESFAREAIRRLDDKLRLEDFYDENLPSISALNTMMGQAQGGAQQNAGEDAPADQGSEGADNSPSPGRTAGAPGGPEITGDRPQTPPM